MDRFIKATPLVNTGIDALKLMPGLNKLPGGPGKKQEKWPNAAEQAEAARQKQLKDANDLFKP